MRSSIWSAMMALLIGVLFFNGSAQSQAQGRPGKGTVILKDQTTSGKMRSNGTGQVVPLGGYYVAPAIGCTVNVSNMGVSDGTYVYVTVEYIATSPLAPVNIGNFAIKGGKGQLSTLSNPTKVSISAGLASMTIHGADGRVLLTGSIRGL